MRVEEVSLKKVGGAPPPPPRPGSIDGADRAYVLYRTLLTFVPRPLSFWTKTPKNYKNQQEGREKSTEVVSFSCPAPVLELLCCLT